MAAKRGVSVGWVLALGVASVAVFGVVAAVVSAGIGTDERPSAPAGEDVSRLRVVNLVAVDNGMTSDSGRNLRASMLDGSMPGAMTLGTVLSDANCAPDAEGISHCSNGIALDDGTTIEVRHNHRMAEVACLTPGERVVVQPA